MMPTAAKLALIACTALGLASCGTSGPSHHAPSTPVAKAVPGPARHAHAGCPLGRLLPAGVGVSIDYVDFVQLGKRSFYASAEHIAASQLGHVITRIRCSLSAEDDQKHGSPPATDRSAAFLPVGTPVYQVRGYLAGCRVAAYGPDGLRVYLAQERHAKTATPLPCATAHRL
ncbi:MAG: hypothetical protein ABJB47_13620 [Actinomycetota bacterium]